LSGQPSRFKRWRKRLVAWDLTPICNRSPLFKELGEGKLDQVVPVESPVLKVAVPERIGFTYASLQGYDTVTVEDRNLLQRLVLEFLV
jgi:hypothetical protein